jgi:MerR family transcriptional regulator, light-induced transcriptional regulator
MSGWTQGRRQENTAESPCDDAWLGHDHLGFSAARSDTLARTVETEIIPRLMWLHRQGGAVGREAASNEQVELGETQTIEFTELILQGHEPAVAYLEALVLRGVPMDALCLHLLAPAARRLGDLWDADICDFTVVTIALGRLQVLLHGLASGMRLQRSPSSTGRSALFVPVPGEQHTFGLTMVCDFFRTSGWQVRGETTLPAEALVDLVRDHRFDLVGVSIGNDRSIDALAKLIRAIRKSSKNRAVYVLAGGPLLVSRPQIAALVGADATAPDARQAILAVERLFAAQDEGR